VIDGVSAGYFSICNGFVEAFNSKLTAKCLNAHLFMSLTDAREKLKDWRRHYNEHRAGNFRLPAFQTRRSAHTLQARPEFGQRLCPV
jgi:transposase InsO family protein